MFELANAHGCDFNAASAIKRAVLTSKHETTAVADPFGCRGRFFGRVEL